MRGVYLEEFNRGIKRTGMRAVFAYSNGAAECVGFAGNIDNAYKICEEHRLTTGTVHEIIYLISDSGSGPPTIRHVNSKALGVTPMRRAHYRGMVELDAELEKEFALVRR